MMPMGCSSLVPYIVAILEEQKPHYVLDLGIGMGFYGAAIRQWLDMGKFPFRTWITGVEGFGAYRNPTWNLYNTVHVMTIERYLDTWEFGQDLAWDAILLMDVLEHFDKEEGRRLLRRLRNHLGNKQNGRLIVGTPAVWLPQGAAYGNELETHKCFWEADELAGEGFTIVQSGTVPNSFGHQMVLGWASAL